MNRPKKFNRTWGFIHALLLAVLLNLSAHMFLHLGDAALETEETHFTTHEAPGKVSAPAHPCSVCQDHQQLALDVPVTASSSCEARPFDTAHRDAFLLVAPSFQRPSGRAPPRS